MTASMRVPLTDASSVGAARREAMRVATNAGASEQKVSTLGIVVTEMATNVITHAREGELLVHASSGGGARVSCGRYGRQRSRNARRRIMHAGRLFDCRHRRQRFGRGATTGECLRRLFAAGTGTAVFAGFELAAARRTRR